MKLKQLLEWYTCLAPDSLASIGEIYHEQARFEDPFNRVQGTEAIAAIFRHMFETLEQPLFEIIDCHPMDEAAWISWRFRFRLGGSERTIEGVTRVLFSGDGRVVSHRDFWDASEIYMTIPWFGGIIRYFKKRIGKAAAIPNSVDENQ